PGSQTFLQEPPDLGRGEPLAFVRHADRHDLVAVAVDGREERARGDERDLVLDRAPTEENGEPEPLHATTSSTPAIPRIRCSLSRPVRSVNWSRRPPSASAPSATTRARAWILPTRSARCAGTVIRTVTSFVPIASSIASATVRAPPGSSAE